MRVNTIKILCLDVKNYQRKNKNYSIKAVKQKTKFYILGK